MYASFWKETFIFGDDAPHAIGEKVSDDNIHFELYACPLNIFSDTFLVF